MNSVFKAAKKERTNYFLGVQPSSPSTGLWLNDAELHIFFWLLFWCSYLKMAFKNVDGYTNVLILLVFHKHYTCRCIVIMYCIQMYCNHKCCIQMCCNHKCCKQMCCNHKCCIQMYCNHKCCLQMYWNHKCCIQRYCNHKCCIQMYCNHKCCIQMYCNFWCCCCIKMYCEIRWCCIQMYTVITVALHLDVL